MVSIHALGQKTYTIQNVKSGKCMDVAAASIEDDANIQQYTCNGSSAQAWKMWDMADENTIKFVANEYSDKILGVGFNPSDLVRGGNIKQVFRAYDDQLNNWDFLKEADGTYTIRPYFKHELCFDIAGASTKSGANVQLWDCNGTDAQKFRVIEHGEILSFSEAKQIISKNSFKAMDVTAASTEYGANIQQWEVNGTDAQKWLISPATDSDPEAPEGFYVIRNVNSYQVLDVAYGGSTDNLIQWAEGESQDNQLWQIVPTNDGDASYYIKSKSDLAECLDVEIASIANGADVRTTGCNGHNAQKWFFH